MDTPDRFFSASYSDQGNTRIVRVPEYTQISVASTKYVMIVISKSYGSFQAGMYVNRGSRWLFALPYDDMGVAFGGDYLVQVVINPVAPLAVANQALVYRGGYQVSVPVVPTTQDLLWTLLIPKTTVAAPPSPTGSSYYEHLQPSAGTVWTIPHSLGKYPSVTLLDSANDEIEGDVSHVSKNVVVATFSAAVSGRALCN